MHGYIFVKHSRVRLAVALCLIGLVTGTVSAGAEAAGGPARGVPAGMRGVDFGGVSLDVPATWQVVDLTADPHACVRYDRAAVYLGPTGDQSECPAHVVGGAPALQLEPLTAPAVATAAVPPVVVADSGSLRDVPVPSAGPFTVADEAAGVLLSAVYGADDADVVRQVLAAATVQAAPEPTLIGTGSGGDAAPNWTLNAPGSFQGKGFDTCAAPSAAAMDAWWSGTDYASIGVYIGGISRGCAQPNLTASWVSEQAATGWHLIPTYVGRQAPCTSFHNRISYDPDTAYAQGQVEADDAAADAAALSIAPPSTLFNDMEGYNSGSAQCVAAVLSYLSGWTNTLHSFGYQSGVYSSASSGIHDLSTHYSSPDYRRPDDIWIAWWNGHADVDGGPYVPDGQWSTHRRVHQYAGNARESHGGYSLLIDRNYLDVSWMVPPPPGCPTNLNYAHYPAARPGDDGPLVRVAQCLLARSGFDPGVANGYYGWRTAAATRAFKESRGFLDADSVLGRWAWQALHSAGPTQFLRYGVRGLRVSKVQRALTARLQRRVPITGFYGPVARRAVMEYQAESGMTVTGTVGVPTWRALQSGL